MINRSVNKHINYFNVIKNIDGPISIVFENSDRSSLNDPNILGKCPRKTQQSYFLPTTFLECFFLM